MKLIIVESPAKAKKIQSFFNDVIVKSSFGHINNLDFKKLDEMISKNFTPIYINTPDKFKVINQLKSVKCDEIILAADDDREGDAIAWHTGNLFKLDYTKNNRIKFNEISKRAISNALDNIEKLDLDSVNAQRTRQFIDLMIGFKISPLLWKHVKTDKKGLSAGRVQSCLLNILHKHEEDIKNHEPEYNYDFKSEIENNDINLQSDFQFNDTDIDDDLIKEIMKQIINDRKCYVIKKEIVEEKSYSPPPLITSTLQQSAQQELGYSVKMTMAIAQKLYENGKITYMRTDSAFISNGFKKSLKQNIDLNYGENYYLNRVTKKVKGAQEAHECIRPTNLDTELSNNYKECDKKLYELIKRRTVISHMQPAIYDVMTIDLTNDLLKIFGFFRAKIKSLKFDGYLKYLDKDVDIIDLKIYQNIDTYKIKDAICKYLESNPPQYYNESSIVKKLEKSGIGRPSTYANLIETLYTRNYTINKDIDSIEKTQNTICLIDDDIIDKEETIKTPKQKKRIIVTDLGKLVLEYLSKNFINLLNVEFTALIEKDLDLISDGELEWKMVIKKIYDSFISIIMREMSIKTTQDKKSDTILGKIKNKDIILKNGKYGYYIQYDSKNFNIQNYLKFKKIEKDNLKIEDCVEIIKYPKKVGSLKKKPVMIHMGPYGYYMKYNNKNIRIDQNSNKWTKDYLINRLK